MKLMVIVSLVVLPTLALFSQEKDLVGQGNAEGQLSSEEKSEVASYMTATWDKLEISIRDLSMAQWTYKPADSIWSIAEIAEHLEKSEIELFNLLTQQLLVTDAAPDKASEVSPKTEMVMEAITSRQQKIKTRPSLEPTGKYASPQEFLESFQVLRNKTLEFSQQTEYALRHHFVPFGPLGELDGYQILMFMSGHLERHSQQIEEVKSDPNYPPA